MLDRNGVRPKDALKEYGIQSYQDDRALKALSTACFPYFGPPDDSPATTDNSASDSDLEY